ncbi:MAG: MerR family transcriptional regulator [Pseudorhodobacter sp.]|nr:MerR family transcriptional regulator [Pseudorhodobacter sp.]
MEKSPDAFRTISEVAEFLDTPAHVLRFWESRFPQVRPIKRAGGRRYYRPNDVALLSGIKRLLHEDGLTIRGVQKILREQGVRHVSGLIEDEAAEEEDDLTLEADVILDGIVSAVPEPAAVLPFPSAARAIPTPIDAEPARHEAPAPPEPLAEPKVTAAAPTLPQDPKPAAPAKRTTGRISPDQGKLFGDEDPPRDAAPKADAPPHAEPDAPQDAADTNPAAMPQTPDMTPEAAAADTADDADLGQPTAAESEPPQEADAAPEAPEPVAAKSAQTPAIEEEAFWLASDLRALRPSRLAQIKAEILPLAQRLQALRDRVAELGRVPRR